MKGILVPQQTLLVSSVRRFLDILPSIYRDRTLGEWMDAQVWRLRSLAGLLRWPESKGLVQLGLTYPNIPTIGPFGQLQDGDVVTLGSSAEGYRVIEAAVTDAKIRLIKIQQGNFFF